ncbi:AUGMIN subunit 1 [Dionaea muscipula]
MQIPVFHFRYRLHVVDLDPSSVTSGGWLEDTSLVEKYKISEEAYDKLDGSDAPVSEVKGGFDAGRIQEVKGWLSFQFESAGKEVPNFEHTPRSIAHFHDLATISKAKTQAAVIVANDFHQKAMEY